MVPAKISAIIEQFKQQLIRRGYRIESVILFGSYSTDRYDDDSDIDIAVVSPDFGKDRFEEGVLLRGIACSIDPRLEPIPVSLTNFETGNWIPLVHEIKEKGIVV